MRRARRYRTALCWLTLLPAAGGWACADMDCSPPQALQLQADQCSLTGLPFLSPDNDTRINLGLLAQARGLSSFSLLQSSPAIPVPISALQPAAPDAAALAEDLRRVATGLGVAGSEVEDALVRQQAWLSGRCELNRTAAALPFLQALQQSSLTAADRQVLASVRVRMLGICDTSQAPTRMPDLAGLPAGVAAPWSAYLQAIQAFYLGQWPQATRQLQALTASDQPWVAETAAYLLVRVGLQQAQATAFDEYGFYDAHQVDPAPARQAGVALQQYLQRWPQGRYASSALGLQRRVAWLSGDAAGLAGAYGQLLEGPQNMALWNELDRRQLDAAQVAGHPLLLLVQDLRRMRAPGVQPAWPLPTAEELAGQRSALATAPTGSLDYLQQAYAYYVAHDYARVAAWPAPVAGEAGDLMAFSQQMLRGMGLMALQRWPAAIQHWQVLRASQQDLARQQLIELAQALTLERSHQLAILLSPDGPVQREVLLQPILRHVAPAELLRQVASDNQRADSLRNTALFTLLFKQLQRGQYADYLRDQSLLDQVTASQPLALTAFRQAASSTSGYRCPTLQETVRTLATQPTAAARNCLGEQFMRQGWDEIPLGDKPAADQLAGSPDRFTGQPQGRLALYRQVIADPSAPRADRSYALYRAINCFASSGSNHCGSDEIPKAERQRWFRWLKDQYADTPWAAQLRYWW